MAAPPSSNPFPYETMRYLFLVVLLLLAGTTYSQTRGLPSLANDRAIIKPRKVVIVRTGDLAKQFPNRKKAIVTYPIVSGLKNPQVLRRVQSLLQVKNAFDSSLEDYRQDAWLEEFGYKVNHNKHFILDITFTQIGSAAYPDTQSKHFAINLQNGRLLKATDVFAADKLGTLAKMVDVKLQAEIKELVQEAKKEAREDDAQNLVDALSQLKFELPHLDEFSVGSTGITFLYDAGFPHVIRALEPEGSYFFTYQELKPFIKRDGLLGQFID